MAGKRKSNAGRPTVMTPEVVKKLEEAFALGCTDLEACFYADISKHTLYNYQNINPEFTDRKEALKERPVLLARACVVKALEAGKVEANSAHAKIGLDYLSKKKRNEFAERKEQDHRLAPETLEAILEGLPEDYRRKVLEKMMGVVG